jgi:hypothetical protein
MGNKQSQLSTAKLYDREGCPWQTERGPRYGNSRKAKAKAKAQDRRKLRHKLNKFELE